MNYQLNEKIRNIVTDIAMNKFKDKLDDYFNHSLEKSAEKLPDKMHLEVICDTQNEIVLKISWGIK